MREAGAEAGRTRHDCRPLRPPETRSVRLASLRLCRFTLVELLVVVAILSILMSLLLPGLKGARGQAQRLRCASNLRNIGLYTNYYLSESSEFFFPVQMTGGAGVVLWRDYVEAQRRGVSTSALPSYCCDPKTLWWCPSSSWIPGSYSGTAWRNTCKYGSNTHLSNLKLPSVKHPSRTVYAVDETLYNGWHAVNKWTSDMQLWISWLHNGSSANRLYLDGHVSAYKLSEYRSSAFASELWP